MFPRDNSDAQDSVLHPFLRLISSLGSSLSWCRRHIMWGFSHRLNYSRTHRHWVFGECFGTPGHVLRWLTVMVWKSAQCSKLVVGTLYCHSNTVEKAELDALPTSQTSACLPGTTFWAYGSCCGITWLVNCLHPRETRCAKCWGRKVWCGPLNLGAVAAPLLGDNALIMRPGVDVGHLLVTATTARNACGPSFSIIPQMFNCKQEWRNAARQFGNAGMASSTGLLSLWVFSWRMDGSLHGSFLMDRFWCSGEICSWEHVYWGERSSLCGVVRLGQHVGRTAIREKFIDTGRGEFDRHRQVTGGSTRKPQRKGWIRFVGKLEPSLGEFVEVNRSSNLHQK